MFCLTVNPNHLNPIKNLNYLPVGLGEAKFSNEWYKDDTGENISIKNKFYGEYTFHYWLWKNYLNKINDGWIGFCQYRKFWSMTNKNLLPNSISELESLILHDLPNSYNKFDVILGDELFINKLKFMKLVKRGFKFFLKEPLTIFNKNKRNIKFHFDMWHGADFLDKAIELLDDKEKIDFKNFINTRTSFNPHNMFICKSKEIIQNYYKVIFSWLSRCEEEFGFENLKGYSQTRIYGFLAERFLSYWFQKNTKYTTLPILFYDIGKD